MSFHFDVHVRHSSHYCRRKRLWFPVKSKRSNGHLANIHFAANSVELYKWIPNGAHQTESVVLWFVMLQLDPSLLRAQSTCHHRRWCNEAGAIDIVSHSVPFASRDDRSASQLLGFVQYVG
ncbi:hypothetical protein TNCV_4216271 [Trichonephila clavipes]|nr:hypothetical protein TNCV_4216271 [Trichonephila clavipes]